MWLCQHGSSDMTGLQRSKQRAKAAKWRLLRVFAAKSQRLEAKKDIKRNSQHDNRRNEKDLRQGRAYRE